MCGQPCSNLRNPSRLAVSCAASRAASRAALKPASVTSVQRSRYLQFSKKVHLQRVRFRCWPIRRTKTCLLILKPLLADSWLRLQQRIMLGFSVDALASVSNANLASLHVQLFRRPHHDSSSTLHVSRALPPLHLIRPDELLFED